MDRRRAEAISLNISEFLLGMGRAGGADERSDGEIQWTVGGSPLAYHNAVIRCNAAPDRADPLIEDWVQELQSRRLPGSWHVSPLMSPPDLPTCLEAHGFVDTGDEPAMAADLSSPTTSSPTRPVAVERVEDEAGLAAYQSVLSQGFGEGPHEAQWVAAIWRRIGLSDDAPWRHYVGRDGDDPVCAASLLITSEVGGVYFVGTVPAARRRGFGAAITAHAMDEARRLGCTLAVLGASEMGYSVYRRLGFEEIFRYRLFEFTPPRAR